MRVAQTYSAKGGKEFLEEHHASELLETYAAIHNVNATTCLRKVSREKTMMGKLLYSPVALNLAIKGNLHKLGWAVLSAPGKKRSHTEPRLRFGEGRFREMDGNKNLVGLEVQFGKYAFMGYDIFSKMIIFKNAGMIECGIEIVAMSNVVAQMSTGVSEFEQILIDFHHRGEADIDIPVLLLGIDLTDDETAKAGEKVARFLENPLVMYDTGEVDRPRSGALPGPK